MQKYSTKTKKRDPIVAARIQKTSDITGLHVRSVQRVTQGGQINHSALGVYMELQEKEEEIFEEVKKNHLIKAVEKLVPLNK